MALLSEAERRPSAALRLALALLLALLGAEGAAADVVVVVHDGRLDVSAQAAPLSEVLGQIAEAIGAEIEYRGPPPGQLVTLALVDQTFAEALLGVLHDHGADFALQMDAAGTSVVKLVIVTDTAVSGEGRPALLPPGPAERPTPPTPEVLQSLMDQLGLAGEEPEAESDDEAPALPETLLRLLNPPDAEGEGPGEEGDQNPPAAPVPPQLSFPTPVQPPA